MINAKRGRYEENERNRGGGEMDERKRKRGRKYEDDDDTMQAGQIEQLIQRLGERSEDSLEENIDKLSLLLVDSLSTYKEVIFSSLATSVLQMPEKITFYSTLAGLINAKNYSAGGELVEVLVRQLKNTLRNDQFESARLLVCFLADLVNCHVILHSSILALFDNLIDVHQEDHITQLRADWYVYAVLSALPWVGRELHEKKDGELRRLVHSIESYMSKRSRDHVPLLQCWSNCDLPQEDALDSLWTAVKALRHTGRWHERLLRRPYQKFGAVLSDALQHSLPQINPPSHHADAAYPLPQVMFRMFEPDDVLDGPALPEANTMERWVLEEQCRRVITAYHLERKECAARMLETFDGKTVPLDYILVEVAMGEMFRLPTPSDPNVFYGAVLLELCKLSAATMPQVLAQATEILFDKLDQMKAPCIDRFASWFSYHLSNFQYRWSWPDWSEFAAGHELSPKTRFLSETLTRCLRLSYHQRLLTSLGNEMTTVYKQVLPPKPTFQYKFEDSKVEIPGRNICFQLVAVLRTKTDQATVLKMIADVPNEQFPEGDAPPGAFNALKIEVFFTALLHVGQKSISHTFSGIGKYYPLLKSFGDTEEGQLVLLQVVYECWRLHQQFLVLIIDKLVKTQIVSCAAVISWQFSDDMSGDMCKFYAWEITHSTLKKINRQLLKCQREVEELRDRADGEENEDLTELEEKLTRLADEQKNLFLIIFQRFIIILTEHVARCEAEKTPVKTDWFKWTIERLHEMFLVYNQELTPHLKTLESLLFTRELDRRILDVFHYFLALKA